MYGSLIKILKPDQNMGGLYLCDLRTINNPKKLEVRNITAIVCATKINPKEYKPFKYFNINPKNLKIPRIKKKADEIIKVLPIEDLENSDISRYFFETVKFIHSKRLEKKNVAVHCDKGISRSVAVLVAYFVVFSGKSVDEALGFVREKHPEANPNFGFMMQLRELERFKKIQFDSVI